MSSEIYLSVIIPAYNEEKTISNTLLDMDKYLTKQDFPYEIIVVSDGGTDGTVRIVTKFTKLIKGLKLVERKENHGKGYSVREGMLKAQGEYRLFTDADNATSLDHFDKVKPLLKEGRHIVIGSRDARDVAGTGQVIKQSFLKRTLGNLGNVLIQLLAVRGIWDTQCGFKVFSRDAAESIFSRALINRWGFDVEALALARRLSYSIGIIPVRWINNPHSRVNWKGYLNTFRELLKIKYNFLRGKYKLNER